MIAVAQLDRLVVADQLVPALRAAMEKEAAWDAGLLLDLLPGPTSVSNVYRFWMITVTWILDGRPSPPASSVPAMSVLSSERLCTGMSALLGRDRRVGILWNEEADMACEGGPYASIDDRQLAQGLLELAASHHGPGPASTMQHGALQQVIADEAASPTQHPDRLAHGAAPVAGVVQHRQRQNDVEAVVVEREVAGVDARDDHPPGEPHERALRDGHQGGVVIGHHHPQPGRRLQKMGRHGTHARPTSSTSPSGRMPCKAQGARTREVRIRYRGVAIRTLIWLIDGPCLPPPSFVSAMSVLPSEDPLDDVPAGGREPAGQGRDGGVE